ncbi:MAG: BNR-4 repeat-containing protein [Sedimentisphaerales bacterium]|nr:BNR-4 repeat-containing protein [Sedimentisphaerales bacterium]
MNKIYILALLGFFSLAGCVQAQSSAKPGEAQLKLIDDGAWCWYQDPRVVYVKGEHERLYLGWMTHDGKLQVGSYDLQTQERKTFTLREKWDVDDHNVNSFLVLPDKRLMAFYARHNRQGLFCRMTQRPEDITAWEDEITVSDTNHITYSHPVYLTEEKRFFVFWRGPSWKPTFSTSTDGKTWTPSQILVRQKGREKYGIRPYMKVVSDGKRSIHFAFTDGHPQVEPTNSLYYLKYENGAFYRANGTKVGTMADLPIQHSQSDVVYDARPSGVRAWVWDIALDNKNRPVITYTRLPEKTDHRYRVAHWTGKTWQDVEVAPGGKWFPQTPEGTDEKEPYYSGGIMLDHGDTNVVYTSRPINGVFEIERWTSSDDGKTWTGTPITKISQKNNVRPVIPRGYDKASPYVLWMHGDYVHYTNFQTDIRMAEVR